MRVWMVLLILTSLVSTWFVGGALFQVWRYFSLDQQAKAHIRSWEVVESHSGRYAVEAEYDFLVKNTLYEGRMLFSHLYFISPSAAESAIAEMNKQSWMAWYQAGDPSCHSLQRLFPFKASIHAILTLGVLVYFLFLKRWLMVRIA